MEMDEKKICAFYYLGRCDALKHCDCDNCRFYKTTEEYERGIVEADAILERKGLKRVILIDGDGRQIVTTEKVVKK